MEKGGIGELRLVLIGSTGSGKSASANTIVGQKSKFKSKMSFSSVTRDCQRETTDITVEEEVEKNGRSVKARRKRRVTVVDTPGFGDTHFSEEQINKIIAQCVSLSVPGPHAFLLVVPIGRYGESEKKATCQFVRIFGEDAVRHHTVVLFTKGDELELDDTTIEEYLREAPKSLQDLIKRCGGRYHVFNNRDPNNLTQVKGLLMKVDNMVMQNNNNNNNGFYTNAMYEEAVAAIRKEKLKKVVVAGATGLAVGAVFGALVPLAAAGGAYVGGNVVSYVAGQISGPAAAAAATEAAGTIVAAASGKTAVAVGTGVGASVGGVIGARVGADAESLGEAAWKSFKQVGVMGGTAVGVAACAGAGMGAGAALTPVIGKPAVTAAASIKAAVTEVAESAVTGAASVTNGLGKVVAGGVAVAAMKALTVPMT